jgi:hypothetical protein
MNVREQQALTVDAHAVRHADVAHVAARSRRADRLLHRLLFRSPRAVLRIGLDSWLVLALSIGGIVLLARMQ